LIIVSVIVVVFIAVAALYRLYIHISMRKEIKSEVDKTLEQYYRYIETFQSADGDMGKKSKPTK
jgi:predicted Holliday junction resolvase-like endonuclease